jgi:hypothetical protein
MFFFFGVAAVDWFAGQGAGANPLYYAGWAFLFTGFIIFFLGISHTLFRPLWLFVLAILMQMYGWWNVFWTMWSDYFYPDGRYFVNGVALANLGPLWPFNTGGGMGVVFISESGFFLTSTLLIIIPIIIAVFAPKDATYSKYCE